MKHFRRRKSSWKTVIPSICLHDIGGKRRFGPDGLISLILFVEFWYWGLQDPESPISSFDTSLPSILERVTMFVYDIKYDDLSKIAYNTWLKWKHTFATPPHFYTINFDDLSRSHRCNPLDPSSMTDITDAAESARTILIGLNREWIRRQGDFFVESHINFLTAIIWYLRNFENGEFCTLPHVIEMMQLGYDRLFTLLRTEKGI